jgi:hypothetical protein
VFVTRDRAGELPWVHPDKYRVRARGGEVLCSWSDIMPPLGTLSRFENSRNVEMSKNNDGGFSCLFSVFLQPVATPFYTRLLS